jgi:lysophospholipase L1-like esterase
VVLLDSVCGFGVVLGWEKIQIMSRNLVKKIFPVVGLAVLAFSLFLNYILYKQMWAYYKALYHVELDPLGLSQYPVNTPIPSDEKPVVVFFGDSRAVQWPAPAMDDFVFVNRGIGNQTSEQVAARFDEHIKPLQPDVVILQVCVNDLKTIPLFPKRKEEIIANCKSNIHKIIQDGQNINAVTIVTTIIPPAEKVPLTRRLAWSDDVYEAVNEVNDYILQLTDDHVIIYDAASAISDNDRKTKLEYSTDFMHLNDNGYQTLNDGLVKILETVK